MTLAPDSPVLALFTTPEIRRRAAEFLKKAEAGSLNHVTVHPDKLPEALVTVLETTRTQYPDFQIPPYGIWRNLEDGGLDQGAIDRWGTLANARGFETAEEMLAAAADLAILSVLFKTRQPQELVFEDPMTGARIPKTSAAEMATLNMFASGMFSSDLSDPFRVDVETLIRLDLQELAAGLQWDRERDEDLLIQMQRHLKRCGEAIALRPDLFADGETTRPGLLAVQAARAADGSVDAGDLLDKLLQALAPVWDGGQVLDDIVLGDSFSYGGRSSQDDVMPFHAAAQLMVYSLVEPFAWAGFEVAHLNALTPPSDEVHAALLVGSGVLSIKESTEPLELAQAQDRMIETRAVTLALIDRLTDQLRRELDVDAEQLPLSCVLEGGTRRAGEVFLRENELLRQKLGEILNPGSVFWLPFGA